MKKLLIVVLGWLIVMTACKKNSDSAIPVTSSSFMFFNGIPDKVYDIWLDTTQVATQVAFGKNSTYRSMRAQLYTMYLVDASDPGKTKQLIGQINLRNKRFFSAYIGYDSANKLNIFRTLEDDLTPPAPQDMKFRVVSLSYAFRPNGQAVAMDLFSQDNRIFRGIGFTQFTPYITLPGDSVYHFNFRRTDDSTIIPSRFDFPSKPGKIYTMVTVGNALDAATFKTFTITHN
ncbi:DUF4397 domain-containing protein [Chitinophaga varians]|uniref:DUF4397 domain-containing protein n=1 Tax=Chitinophaga varians TaxID=2202339 RepID=UPI00165EFC1D|nr:DUF4397 domain-containing protein [Chitinophaga varians]MBC9912418.1 DUF4397 domain-containing protein [Chitinophaga varians]